MRGLKPVARPTQPIIMRFTGCYSELQRQSIGVNDHVKLLVSRPLDRPNRFARAVSNTAACLVRRAPSTCWMIFTVTSCAAASASMVLVQIPARRQRTNRLNRWYGADRRLGKIGHGAPDRNTQKIPLRTRRSSTRATPRGCSAASFDDAPFVVGKLITHDCGLRIRNPQHFIRPARQSVRLTTLGLRRTRCSQAAPSSLRLASLAPHS